MNCVIPTPRTKTTTTTTQKTLRPALAGKNSIRPLNNLEIGSVCGHQNKQAENYAQTIRSPHYPNEYEDNLYCLWKISAPVQERIVLFFYDFNVMLALIMNSLTSY